MYLFRQFWAILWLADFFQKLIVSRASVNGDLQKGPHLPQSFSTKVVIESGLYIAPGSHFSAGRRSIWEVQPGPGSRVGSRTWLDLPDRPSDQPLRPDPGSRVGSRVWPGKWLQTANLARITSRARNRQNRQNLDFSRKLEILVISAISGSGRDSDQIRVQMLSELMVWAHVHIGVQNHIRQHMCTACSVHASTHWHSIWGTILSYVASIL